MTQSTSLQVPSHNRTLGAHGEALAAEYLQSIGCEILSRNWRYGRAGELDLVVREGDTIAAVEVKTRSGLGYGTPFESITVRKTARLRTLLIGWVRANRPAARRLRVDAIGVTVLPGVDPKIEHLRGIA